MGEGRRLGELLKIGEQTVGADRLEQARTVKVALSHAPLLNLIFALNL